jgi:hypothetical protein
MPASNPSGPSVTAARAAAFVTMVNVTSEAAATAFGRLGELHPFVDQPLRFGARPVVAGHGVTFFEQARHHVAAHHTEADETRVSPCGNSLSLMNSA